jgi:two-component system invasion response regulator UvrY
MNAQTPKTKIALVDDHVLLRKGLADYIRTLKEYDVVMEASDGQDFIRRLVPEDKPEIVLLDIHMPQMNGYETASWLTAHHPDIKILALSVSDGEHCILRMIRSGAKGYVVKDIDPHEFKCALDDLVHKGFYYSDLVTGKLVRLLHARESRASREPRELRSADAQTISLNKRELDFLRFVCTEMTYKEIAGKMYLSVRTIDGYRDTLFDKLQVRTRVGLVMYAIRSGIVEA